jgi:hypothetical protein
MFTIQVKEPKKPDFQASDLLLFHGQCGGGAIKKETDHPDYWSLVCVRCHATGKVEASAGGTSAICLTALDGEARPIKRSYYDDKLEDFVAERIG